MKIAIIGSKGIPAKHGGFETFAEKISQEFEKNRHEVIVIGDCSSEYLFFTNNIRNIQVKFNKSKNPLKFWHASIRRAKEENADIILHCGVAGIFSHLWFMSLWNKTFINPDGLGFKRSKYSFPKKTFLLLQFIVCAIFARYIIADSEGIKLWFRKYFFRKRKVFVAEYGSVINYPSKEKEIRIQEFALEKKIYLENGYFLVIARLEPENNVELIIKSYLNTSQSIPLLVVGGLDTKFYQNVLKKYSSTENVYFLGGIYDSLLLQSLRVYCTAYIHGHTVGGTNPSLLEAMGSNNKIFAHNNIFNKYLLGASGFYFKNVDDLAGLFESINHVQDDTINRTIVETKYTWEIIGEKYLKILYEEIK